MSPAPTASAARDGGDQDPASARRIPEEIGVRNWIPVGEDTNADRVLAAIDTDLDWEKQHPRLMVKALEWDESERDRSFLLRGAGLSAAERWPADGSGKDPGPTASRSQAVSEQISARALCRSEPARR